MKINVDKIYVCHWNKLVDRKEILYQQFLKYEIENEIEYVEDFDVEDLDTCLYNDYYKSINSYNSIMRRYNKKSEISLFYKHIKILEMFEKSNYDSILVLEDDAFFTEDILDINKYLSELPIDYDICWVGSCCDLKSSNININQHVYKENGSRCTHGFILNRRIFNKVIVFDDVPICVADAYYNHLIDDGRYSPRKNGIRLNNYWMEPPVILQNKMFDTTIQK